MIETDGSTAHAERNAESTPKEPEERLRDLMNEIQAVLGTSPAERHAETPAQKRERRARLEKARFCLDGIVMGMHVLICWEDGTPAIQEVDGQTFIIERCDGKVTVRGVGQEGEGVGVR